ncbi:hypothetical protein [Lactobacillus sp. PSON]|uniref:hypothetical protein n=1 Tax=Lactobacillus sp. PSON TaxID=3455454 RepID=UPI004042452A
MSKFGLGLAAGAAAGFVLSLFKDQNGNRLGASIKRDFDSFMYDAESLAEGIQNAKKASYELTQSLPQAERAVSDISDDVSHYSERIAPDVTNIEKSAQKIETDLDNTTKKN